MPMRYYMQEGSAVQLWPSQQRLGQRGGGRGHAGGVVPATRPFLLPKVLRPRLGRPVPGTVRGELLSP